MADQVVTSFAVPNYSGLLFNKGNTKTPFSTLIANNNPKQTNHVEFVTGQEFQTEGGSQPNISETASLTAPEATRATREQKKNVTQIFMEAIYESYAKQSNMGTLSGLNIAGQLANPATKRDFQIAVKMAKIARDIEYTFINGVYQLATTDAEVNKTRGMVTAITSNIVDLAGAAIRLWDVAEAMKSIYESQGSLNGLVLWVDAVTSFQLHADAEQNGLTVVPAAREINGIKLTTILTPLGEIGLYIGEFLPSGTCLIINPAIVGRVEQFVPGKGNFFVEELAKTGAGIKEQIFGQIGLDHGPEWMHAKITGINPNFVKPQSGTKIFATAPIPTTNVLPVLESVTLAVPQVGVETDALVLQYTGEPSETPTLAYQWKISTSPSGVYADIADATSATYTPAVGDVDKYIKCEVTATVTAKGVVLSNAKKVIAA